jgi:flavin-dependent dehydrogenase
MTASPAIDVLIAGAGPAGSIAGLLLARAGARVLIIDRQTFPRDKLCGDTINPGCLRFFASLGLSGGALECGRSLSGMLVSAPSRQERAEYGKGLTGTLLRRRDLDVWLLKQAIAAGAGFESDLVARDVAGESTSGRTVVKGLRLGRPRRDGSAITMQARIVIAADGLHSGIARAAGLVRARAGNRRWAFGAYMSGVTGLSDLGEMHVRPRAYVGIAPFDGGLANVCVVTFDPPRGMRAADVIRGTVNSDPCLRDRFVNGRIVEGPRTLGPLGAERSAPGVEGLLLAGDAAGFVDPMTGDGMHLAVRGAALAADAARYALETGDRAGAVPRLAASRARVLGPKIRFNRVVRRVTGSRSAVALVAGGASLVPSMVRTLVRYAGDVA